MKISGPSLPPPMRPRARKLPYFSIMRPNSHIAAAAVKLQILCAYAEKHGVRDIRLCSEGELHMVRVTYRDRTIGRGLYAIKGHAKRAEKKLREAACFTSH